MRTVAVLQPGYLPWLGFFDQMHRSDVFILYDDVQYDKHGWRNRNRIKSPAGPHWLTVPVLHKGLDAPRILDVEIDNRAPWARKHVGTIRQFYGRAPHLKRYVPELEELLHQRWERLVDLDLAVIKLMCRWLGLRRPTPRSSQLGIEGYQSERLVKLCVHFDAKCYLTGSAAKDYLDVDLFAQREIAVEWQDYQHPTYPQQHGEFAPYLSALDLILNCGDESLSRLSHTRPAQADVQKSRG